MSIRHIVMWKLAATEEATRTEHGDEVARRLQSLVAVIPEIQSLDVGINVVYPEKNWDVVLVAEFADAAALERYQVHPAHLEAAAYVRSVIADRASVDSEV